MNAPKQPLPAPATTDAAAVAAWLAAHPRFLAEHPALYAVLEPPVRLHGEVFADHMAAMLAAARTGGRVAAARREAAQSLAACVQAAVLALVEQPDPRATVAEDWPRLLNLAVCKVVPLAAGLMPQSRTVLLRDGPATTAALHGEAAPLVVRDALLRLELPEPMLLVLGAREAQALPMRGGLGALEFLARALAAVLRR
ncbi:uncharacterized protein YigA (DUF484 family) [Humitalea rosea]|uniref:Uncharacterized protein YigA (DUF484 family) n=1 Tax=Humitalea rosea TaxID=990373 RepID=A0A2W7K6L9_9PROT|nr:hypothetical protein [Humitalea rosea]PZW43160.1 uncharacterized protein YigA (DUF484 family) [Humitalea rosea]